MTAPPEPGEWKRPSKLSGRASFAGDSNAAENVGAGHSSVEDAINAWIRSPHHHENMLMKDATRFGMVVADAPNSRYRNYWALDLASAAAGAPAKVATAKPSVQPADGAFSMVFPR
jgi:hypothetical protein